jgi:hypothetical protein
MLRWQRTAPALGHADGIHLTQLGYEQLATSFMKDLLSAYESHKVAPREQVQAPTPATPLTPAPVARQAEGG